MSSFYPFVVVGRDSKTQLQVGENSNYLINILIDCFILCDYITC